MHHYGQGKSTRQAHKDIPEGHFEEEQGQGGFYGPVSHLIRKNPSTRWTDIQGPLKPRMFDLMKFMKQEGELNSVLYNEDCTVYTLSRACQSEKEKEGFRNADGDLIYFCHKGKGSVLTDYGLLKFKASDYIVIPKSLVHTLKCETESEFFVIENKTSHFQEPDRGIVGRHALYDENALQKPDLEKLQEELPKQDPILKIVIKKHNEKTIFSYKENIYDVIGWKGDLFPFVLSMDHIMPLMSHRAHLPPSAHTTFVARGFIVCSFLPRPLEQDKDALKVPFYHQNTDYDEVIFYHAGDFFSRDNLKPGMMSFHPAGFSHGPHPKAFESVSKKTSTSEYAVMIDSAKSLYRTPLLDSSELENYWKSWGLDK